MFLQDGEEVHMAVNHTVSAGSRNHMYVSGDVRSILYH